MNKQKQKPGSSPRIFLENPYDLETIFESLTIATSHGKELQFMDKFVAYIRLNPEDEVTNVCYNVLRTLDILKLEKK